MPRAVDGRAPAGFQSKRAFPRGSIVKLSVDQSAQFGGAIHSTALGAVVGSTPVQTTVLFHNGLELQMEAHELLLHMPASQPEAALIVVNAQIRALFRELDTGGTAALSSHELFRLGTLLSDNWTASKNKYLYELLSSHGKISFLQFEDWITGAVRCLYTACSTCLNHFKMFSGGVFIC